MKDQNPLSSSPEEGLINWINRFGWYVLYGVIALMIIALVAFRMSAGGAKQAGSDYLKAEKAYQSFRRGVDPQENLQELKAILKRYPDLNASYGSLIAQQLLAEGNVAEAEKFADSAILRTTNDNLPFYSDYTVITLKISQGDYRRALDKTLLLKEGMLKNLELAKVKKEPKKFGDVLFAYNLLREALLMQQLEDREGERRALAAFKQYANSHNGEISSIAFRQVMQQFDSGKESLMTYIQQREKALNAAS